MQYVGVDLIEADKLTKLLTKAEYVTTKAKKKMKYNVCEKQKNWMNYMKKQSRLNWITKQILAMIRWIFELLLLMAERFCIPCLGI